VTNAKSTATAGQCSSELDVTLVRRDSLGFVTSARATTFHPTTDGAPGGVLSQSDAATRAYAARECAAASEKNERVVCDRLRGKTEVDVLADSKKAGDQEPWIPALAAVTPPFRIP
jgi:hypothetical protein